MKHFLPLYFVLALSLILFALVPVAAAHGNAPSLQSTPQATQSAPRQNKVALRLAQKYGVSYDDIIALKNKGVGYGEMGILYSLLAKTKDRGSTVDGLLAMRANGLGWGEIAKVYGVSLKEISGAGKPMGKPDKLSQPDKPHKPGKADKPHGPENDAQESNGG